MKNCTTKAKHAQSQNSASLSGRTMTRAFQIFMPILSSAINPEAKNSRAIGNWKVHKLAK